MLARFCLLLCAIGIALSLSSVGQLAAAQQAENLWKDAQDRGVLRAGAALAPPHVMRDPKTGEYDRLS
jgi:polar amino acid transport system substrate-binding protein